MSALDKYNTPSPRISNKNRFDNPLLPKGGVPLADDDFVDSTDRIVNATNANDVRFDNDTKVGNHNVWSVDPSQFYDSSGLSGIDTNPGSSKKFDLGQFNKSFERNKEIALQSQKIDDLNRLNALSQETERISLYDLSLYQIIINIKNTWFNLLDDLLDQKFELETFTADNRLFYIGLTILFFGVVFYLYATILTDNSDNSDNSDQTNVDNNHTTKTVYHIYQYPQTQFQPLQTQSLQTQPSQPLQTQSSQALQTQPSQPLQTQSSQPLQTQPLQTQPLQTQPLQQTPKTNVNHSTITDVSPKPNRLMTEK